MQYHFKGDVYFFIIFLFSIFYQLWELCLQNSTGVFITTEMSNRRGDSCVVGMC